MNKIIYIDMPTFWINLNNPEEISYTTPLNPEGWEPIQVEGYGPGYLENPTKHNISYIYKKKPYLGYMLNILNQNKDE